MPSLPLTSEEEKKLLSFLGIQSADDLFSSIPPNIRDKTHFTLDMGDRDDGTGRGLTEHELRDFMGGLGQKNWHGPEKRHFLGGGIYDNIIPAIVNQLVLRGEFLTCYTPYQPEISQGTLQAIFEFQTMICRMTGMPIANASMYDGATATAEAMLMAQRLSSSKPQGGQEILIAASLHPEYREVANTFLEGHSSKAREIPWAANGTVNLSALSELLKTHKPCAVVIPSPNYFGLIEPLDQIKAMLPEGCLLIVSVADPSALSIFEAPGNFGADIVAGEGHQLGTPMLFGGPHVGFFATRKEFLRQMPGRICGETVDIKKERAYTLTLSTREQHIRREKATSNICTNQGLIALRTTIYLSFLGKAGFERLGETNYSLFDYLSKGLEKAGVPLKFKGIHYREGVFQVPNLEGRWKKALQAGIIPGIRLAQKFTADHETELKDCLLVCVHPKHTKKDLDDLIGVLSHE